MPDPTPPATNAPSTIGALVASLGIIEFQKLLESDDGRAPEHALVGRELYIDARHHQRTLTTLRRNPECRFDHEIWSIESLGELPLGELLAGGEAGEGEISLAGHVFVKEITCQHCQRHTVSAVLRDRARLSQLRCEGCSWVISPTALEVGTWLAAAELPAEMLLQPLRERGFRPGDVVTLRAGEHERHFEYAPQGERPPDSVQGGRWKSAVVVGCGNIGSNLISHVARLARSGALERVILVDPDTYSEANLAGQEINRADVGCTKVGVQAARMRAIHPELEVLARVCRIEDLPLSALRGAILLGAVDSRDARQQINQAAWRIGSPWIDMAVDGPSLLCRVTTYFPADGSVCLECTWDPSDYSLLGQRLPCDRIHDSHEVEGSKNSSPSHSAAPVGG